MIHSVQLSFLLDLVKILKFMGVVFNIEFNCLMVGAHTLLFTHNSLLSFLLVSR